MNRERLQLVIDYIKLFPETYDQKITHSACNTKHCIAGHAELMFWEQDCVRLKIPEVEHEECFPCTWYKARFCLGLTEKEAVYLFAASRHLYEIEEFVHDPTSQYNDDF